MNSLVDSLFVSGRVLSFDSHLTSSLMVLSKFRFDLSEPVCCFHDVGTCRKFVVFPLSSVDLLSRFFCQPRRGGISSSPVALLNDTPDTARFALVFDAMLSCVYMLKGRIIHRL